MAEIPARYQDLVDRPLIASLATVREDGTPQVNPMWFSWDGEFLRFTHTNYRQKFRNLAANPSVSVSIYDPEQPYRYLEIRGRVERIDPDPTGAFFVELAKRYDAPFGTEPPPDASRRIIVVIRPTTIPQAQDRGDSD